MTGTIISGTNNFFEVEVAELSTRVGEPVEPPRSFERALEATSTHILTCSIKGKQLKIEKKYYNPLAPGDKVEIEKDTIDENKGQIVSLLPRKNKFVRFNIKGRAPQLLASNLDYLVLVTTPDEPPFRPRFIDRALAQAEYEGIEPIIVANKCDLEEKIVGASHDGDVGGGAFQKMLTIWESLGYKVLRVSAKTGDGIAELAEILKNHLSAFVGQSGVGKSSLINALDPTAELRTGELCQKYGRGAHTTTKGVLMKLKLAPDGKSAATMPPAEGGASRALSKLRVPLVESPATATAQIIDTPGVRQFNLHEIEADDLAMYFREIAPFIGKCKFGISCRHENEPECAVRAAISDGKISGERFESFERIRSEI